MLPPAPTDHLAAVVSTTFRCSNSYMHINAAVIEVLDDDACNATINPYSIPAFISAVAAASAVVVATDVAAEAVVHHSSPLLSSSSRDHCSLL